MSWLAFLINMADLHELYLKYKPCIVRVTVTTEAGDLSTGTGFHIGDGLIVTARHVMRETIRKRNIVGESEMEIDRTVESITREIDSQALTMTKSHYHPDNRVDLAVLETNFEDRPFSNELSREGTSRRKSISIPIGSHFDDWIGDQFVLKKVLVMGYPAVPRSQSTVLLATEGELNALVPSFRAPHPYYIVSSTARGGFSGAPVISAAGSVIGIIVESLYGDDKPEETGFSAAITIEPLIAILVGRGSRPACVDLDVWAKYLRR
jgi:S1-C subfamily serine protease